MSIKKAIEKINKRGSLLVFPIKNQQLPHSLWSELHPRSEMRWDWDETGDNRVVKLWWMMKDLSQSGEVVYSKWYQGRATFFSKELFVAALAFLKAQGSLTQDLNFASRDVLDLLSQDSPQSTKEIKAACDLQGKLNEGLYNKAMRQLYQRFLIVGFGEKEDGAFPSSMMGTTHLMFEDLWRQADHMAAEKAKEILEKYW